MACFEDDVCKLSPVISLNSFSLVPDLKKFHKPPISITSSELEALKSQIDEIYLTCETGFGKNTGDDLEVLRYQWGQCKPLIKAKMWATEPLAQTLEGAIRYYVGQGSLIHALSIACFARLNCDPYKHVAPFKQWRLKGLMVIAKMLTNTAPYPAMLDLAKKTEPSLLRALQEADQVTICQAMLLMVTAYGPMAHSEEWEILVLAKDMLRDIESLEGRETESSLLRAWARQEGGADAVFFEREVLRKVEHLASFAIGVLEKDLRRKSLLAR